MFTAPSLGHHIRNPFDNDLVYLMGGENREFEIFEKSNQAYIVDAESMTPFTSRSAT